MHATKSSWARVKPAAAVDGSQTQAQAINVLTDALKDIAELHEVIAKAEAALGNNLVWLDDKFDLSLRQEDRDVQRRLSEMKDAWSLLCKAMQHGEKRDFKVI